MNIKRKNVLILEYSDLPDHVREIVRKWVGFGNDAILPARSEFDVESWSKGFSEVEAYWENQKKNNRYKGSSS